MKPLSSMGYMHLTMLAKPACDRAIYKLIRKYKYRSFVEVGMGSGSRCLNMIKVAKRFGASPNVRYTGVDEFDGRDESLEKLALIEMHRKLKATDAKTQLVPGDLQSAVNRIANSHVRTDMIVISAGFEPEALDACWFFMPRMLHSGSVVLIQDVVDQPFKCMNRLEIEKLADKQQTRKTPNKIAA